MCLSEEKVGVDLYSTYDAIPVFTLAVNKFKRDFICRISCAD